MAENSAIDAAQPVDLPDDTIVIGAGGRCIRLGDLRRKPGFAPVHKLPCWLSSEDVLAAIRQLSAEGVDKAACWDFTQAVYRLVEAADQGSAPFGMDRE